MSRLTLRPVRLTMVLASLAVILTTAGAASASDVILIEEHWELHVGGPDASRSAPQVTMIMSPTESLAGDFFAVAINHWSFPDFASGGVEVQRWSGEECVTAAHGSNHNALDHDGEVISWVQRLSLVEGHLKFEVLSGTSTSWGSFGAPGELLLTVPTQLSRLDNYRPAISLGQSGIGYAGNRVSSLVLQRLRWTTADGEQHEMVAPIDIDADLDP